MVVQDRYSALQNENVRLYHIFEKNGQLLTLPEAPAVTVMDQDGTTVLEIIQSTMQSRGMYFADYFVPIGASLGQYYDKWTFRYTANDPSQEVITQFQVHPKDAILNFSSSLVSQQYTDKMEGAIRDLANYFIYETMHIPVYGEQAMRTETPKRFNFAFKHWNMDPRPTVRINTRIADGGYYADYLGNIFFEDPLDSTDTVFAHYNFAYFSKEDLAGFIHEGIAALNSIPPVSGYSTIDNTPMEWHHAILLYASISALRRMLLGLSFQEIAIIFGNADQIGNARDIIKGLYDSYSETWKEQSAGLKKKLPNMGAIVIPEYTLPGGRARWYRYMYVSGVS